ncbi:uncharacterized protein MONBRDRAFT_8517 [Monosiga brevicollis MX1]|uniref:BEACH domain-containing protein n=1 Tax=Monosiga brevicollis TaxID=81824 RepID=A9V098_MONBE|nr:uncharacterized protein MONBRDRAFT_8517 [Monosiga brevicollis MX1]EDQ89120.1 predicted protein [Monosiga brevicollis MX1]|eukprot:XP_001746225.1 hypothetical protein [Monosiga brevicollis MX1]
MRLRQAPLHNFSNHEKAASQRDNATSLLSPKTFDFDRRESVSRLSHAKSKQTEQELKRFTSSVPDHIESQGTEVPLFSSTCRMVCLMDTMRGIFAINRTSIMFHAELRDLEALPIAVGEDMPADFQWPITQLREVHLRRYNLRSTALELFFIDQTNFFFDFDEGMRDQVHQVLISLKPPRLTFGARMIAPGALLTESGLTERWCRRQISNFDYLMMLNTIAGRSFNDLNQYPVFPWILADYSSDMLDLSDPATFRDLTKPVGALNARRADQVKMMFDDFVDPSGLVAKFHYGTHYSNAAGVLHYLIRMEPFTSLHINLQSGKFDHADRQFISFSTTYQSIVDGTGDVKELIPDLFCLPESLMNREGFDLGCLQNGQRVHHVDLPPWARSPFDFIQKHRAALESEHVSQQLHHWIDLIFGYKQRGKAAEEALNVFYYTSYEGAIDLSKCETEAEVRAQEGMVREFGQTPSQLLTSPHPARMGKAEDLDRSRLSNDLQVGSSALFEDLKHLKAYFVAQTVTNVPIVVAPPRTGNAKSWLTRGLVQRLVTLSNNGAIAVHGWVNGPQGLPELEPDTTPAAKQLSDLRAWLEPGNTLSNNNVDLTRDSQFALVGGSWDHHLKLISVATRRVVYSARGHRDIISCVALDANDRTCASGCVDGTVMVWTLHRFKATASGAASALGMHNNGGMACVLAGPHHTLVGHDGPITALCLQEELDLLLTAAGDATCNLYSIRQGLYLRTLDFRALKPALHPIGCLGDLVF